MTWQAVRLSQEFAAKLYDDDPAVRNPNPNFIVLID